MKIKEISENFILFDNGNMIACSHEQDCCEHNYADFEQLDDIARNYDYKENLIFEEVEGAGFRFGDRPERMFFVSCYSVQNGYYSSLVDVYYNHEQVLSTVCEMVYD